MQRGQSDIAWCMAYQLPLIWIMRFVAQFQNNFNQKYWLEGPCFLKGNVISARRKGFVEIWGKSGSVKENFCRGLWET